MATMRLGNAGDNILQCRISQPFRRTATQDAFAPGALAGDHKNGTITLVPGPANKGIEGRAGPVLVIAMQVDPRADRVTFPGDAVFASGLDPLRTQPGMGRTNRGRNFRNRQACSRVLDPALLGRRQGRGGLATRHGVNRGCDHRPQLLFLRPDRAFHLPVPVMGTRRCIFRT